MKRLLLTTLAIAMTAWSWAQCSGTISTNTSNDPTITFTWNTTAGQFDSWWWDFGDGTTGSGQTATHTYTTNGVYSVCVWAIDSMGGSNCVTQVCDSLMVSNAGSTSCGASFAAYDSLNYVYFNNTSTGSNLNYFWDFGDGNTSTQSDPAHTYPGSGNYTVCLTVWNANCSDTLCQTINVGCSADFYYIQSNNTTGQVDFYSNAVGNNLNYSWNFGDGSFSNQANPTHTFANPGAYAVCLTVDDGAGCSASFCDSVTVQAAVNCNADFASYDSAGTVYFWNQSTGNSPYYFWDFGDGQWSTNTNPTHTYSNPGTYTVCLIVSTQNCSDTLCSTVTVGSNTTCDADFFIYQDSVNPSNFYAVNMSSGSNLTYTWSWGDGTTSTGQYPSHTYSNSGMYGVCLTVDNGMGCTDTHCDTVIYVPMQGGSFTVNVVPPTSNSIDEQSQLEIDSRAYPNPTTGNFTLELNSTESATTDITVVDVSGRVVYQTNTTTSGTMLMQVDASGWNTGIYMIRVQPENGVPTTTRIVKR